MWDGLEINAKIEELIRKSEDQSRQIQDLKREIENQTVTTEDEKVKRGELERYIEDLKRKIENHTLTTEDEKVKREELERYIEDLKREIENQTVTTEDEKAQREELEHQIEDLRQELSLAKTILSTNVVINDEDTQILIAHTNSLTDRLQHHHAHKSLTILHNAFSAGLRKYCEALLPMASGMYLPHHRNKLLIEITHEGVHLAEHLVHEGAEVVANYFPSLQDVIKVTGEAVHQVPLLKFAIAVYELRMSHQFIHEAKQIVGMLRAFSAEQRNLLYRNVPASTLLSLATRIDTNAPINHPVAKKHLLPETPLGQWYTLLLGESVSSLSGLSSIEGINRFAIEWSESIVQKFVQPGADMFNLQEINQVRRYSLKDLKTTLKVQRIFTEPMSNSSHTYLTKSLSGSPFLDEFHRKLYHNVLEPYRRCANQWKITAFFRGYLSVLKTLQKWQSRFNHALAVINEELRLLKEQDSPNYELELIISNTCLLGNLQGMCAEMPWHKPANRLFIDMSNQNLDCIREPLKITDDNELELNICKTLILEANARATRVENEHAMTKEELAGTKGELAKSENERALTKEELAKSENEHALTKEELAKSENEHALTKEELAKSENEHAMAKREFAETKGELAETKQELIKANARSANYEARAAQVEAINLKYEKIITLLEGKRTPSQSPLVQNSLFNASGGENIIEENMAGPSYNSTLQ